MPKVYLVGMTQPNWQGIQQYLEDTQQTDFASSWDAFVGNPMTDAAVGDSAIAMVSMFAKMCYASLVLGKNANVTRIRDIEDNIKGVIKSKHGSVMEHLSFNFIVSGCSRVFTHELVRHRVGTAFSQTSGRYVALDNIQVVFPPQYRDIPYRGGQFDLKTIGEFLDYHLADSEDVLKTVREHLITDDLSFDEKKKRTSAIRRYAPNGQTNEIAFTANWRAIRNILVLRTSRGAEWEMRLVMTQIATLLYQVSDLLLWGENVQTDIIDGFTEYKGLEV